MCRIAAQLTLIVGAAAVAHGSIAGRHAGWELMAIPLVICLLMAIPSAVGAVVGALKGELFAAFRTAAPATVGVVLALIGFVLGA